MKKERSLICGMTDYTGVDLETIVNHLKDWKSNTEGTINELKRHLTSVHENWDRIDIQKRGINGCTNIKYHSYFPN
jgi:hypothetical protein